MHRYSPFVLLFTLLVTEITHAQFPAKWKQHDFTRPRPPVVAPGAQKLPVAPPADAIVLFDGNDLSKWRSPDSQPAKWVIIDGVMESDGSENTIVTTAEAY